MLDCSMVLESDSVSSLHKTVSPIDSVFFGDGQPHRMCARVGIYIYVYICTVHILYTYIWLTNQ